MKKYLPHLLALLFFVCASTLFVLFLNIRHDLSVANAALEAQASQLAGKKVELQQANTKLGLAESAAVSRESLLKKYENQVNDLNIEIGKLKDKLDAKPVSHDSGTIVIWKEVPGGEQGISKKDDIISYDWKDLSGRFHLIDPNISRSGDEQFTYKLKIRVSGYVLADPSGKIQARQVVAQEVIEHKDENGRVSETLGDPLPIENNIYEYAAPERVRKISDIIAPRAYALFNTSLNPGIGAELINLGNYFDYMNLGAGPFMAIDTSNLPGSIKSSLIGVGLEYTLIPPLLSTNIGLGIGIATPADDFFGRFIVTGNILFYLTN